MIRMIMMIIVVEARQSEHCSEESLELRTSPDIEMGIQKEMHYSIRF